MSDLNYFIARMRWWCEDANLGYGQDTRWNIHENGDADCSSLVIHTLQEAGFDTGDANSTHDLLPALAVRGWTLASPPLMAGDILISPGNHVATYLGDGMLAEANINENGDIINGRPGDQTGQETRVTDYYDYPWDYILRYTGNTGNDTTETNPGEDYDMKILTDENEIGYLLNCHSCKRISYEQAKALMEIGVENRHIPSTTLYAIMEAVHESAYDMTVTAEAYKAAAQRLAAASN